MIFHYSFSDPCINRTIRADMKEFKTVDDLIQKIASDLHLKKFKISVKNPPKEKQLSSLPNEYQFQLGILNQRKDIKFEFPNNENLIIKDCYKMNFNDAIQCFQKNGFYFSPVFIRTNLHILKSGEEISLHENFPFFSIAHADKVEVRMSGNFVTFNYAKKNFYFSENETSWTASEFIFKFFPEIKYVIFVTFSNALTGRVLKGGDKLKHDEKYNIKVECEYHFRCISHFYYNFQKLDYLAKIPDAKQRLAIILSYNNELLPENIIIFDKNKNEIEDQNQYLKDIQSDKREIYFDIVNEPKPKQPSKYQNEKAESKPPLYSKTPNTILSSKEVKIEPKPSDESKLISTPKSPER